MCGRRLKVLTLAAFVASAMSSGTGLADDRHDCEKLKGEPSISACTALIEAGTYSASVMAIAYLNRGLEYFDKGYYDQAISDYSASIALNPKNADVFNNRGNAYHAKRDYDRAIGDFNQAIAIDPGHVLAYNNRAIAYGTKGEPDRAIEDFSQAIALNPAYAGAYSNRGNIFFKNGEFDRALADFDRAIVINPKNALFYRNRARAYQELRLYDRAIADYQRSLELKPSENAQAGLKVKGGGWVVPHVVARCQGYTGMQMGNQVARIALRSDCRRIGHPVEGYLNNQQAQQHVANWALTVL